MKEKILNILNNRRAVLLLGLYAIVALFIISVILYILLNNARKGSSENPSIVTPTLIPNYTPPPTYPPVQPSDTTIHKHLAVISTSPINNQKNVPVTLSNITITFDQTVAVSDVPLSIAPSLPYAISSKNNSIIITPKSQLLPGITYFIFLRLYNSPDQITPFSLSFTTEGITPTPLPADNFNVQDDFSQQRQAAPDVFLSNYTPHSGSDFSISSTYNLQIHHYQFTVALTGSDQNQAKQDFITWLKSLQFTDQQIQALDITYQ